MAYDEFFADRIRRILRERNVGFEERNMMGGYCVMVDDKMCVGIARDFLMARVGPDFYEEALGLPGCRPMDFTGRPMKGYVFIDPAALDSEEELGFWVDKCLAFNPLAKSSKKR